MSKRKIRKSRHRSDFKQPLSFKMRVRLGKGIVETEEDHKAALSEIERLWGSSEGTPNGKRFSMMAQLVEEYENKKEIAAEEVKETTNDSND